MPSDASKFKLKSIPPQINSDLVNKLQEASNKGSSLLTFLSSGNFVISLILGGSLQQLWSLIRSLQFIILTILIRVPLAGHAFKFFEGCAEIAQFDIFDGQGIYNKLFEITDASPLNDNYELLGITGKNFLINSGSFFIFLIGIILFRTIQKSIDFLARCCAHRSTFRKIGVAVHSKSTLKDILLGLFKLFIESYFDLTMCVALHNLSLGEVDMHYNPISVIYFSNFTDASITVLNFVFTALVLTSPIYCQYIIGRNHQHLNNHWFQNKFDLLLEGNTKSLQAAFFTVFFLYRRFLTIIVLVFMEAWPFF